MWTAPKTWLTGTGGWLVGEANTYIRDNFKSLRNYAASTLYVPGDTAAATTAITNFAVHANLCPVTPDEASRLVVVTTVRGSAPTGGCTYAILNINDSAGTLISMHVYMSATVIAGNFTESVTLIGGADYPAGTNPGFQIAAQTNAGGLTLAFNTMARVSPITT